MIDNLICSFMLSGRPGTASNNNIMPGHQRRQQRWREQKRRQRARKRRAEMLHMDEAAIDMDWELPQGPLGGLSVARVAGCQAALQVSY